MMQNIFVVCTYIMSDIVTDQGFAFTIVMLHSNCGGRHIAQNANYHNVTLRSSNQNGLMEKVFFKTKNKNLFE